MPSFKSTVWATIRAVGSMMARGASVPTPSRVTTRMNTTRALKKLAHFAIVLAAVVTLTACSKITDRFAAADRDECRSAVHHVLELKSKGGAGLFKGIFPNGYNALTDDAVNQCLGHDVTKHQVKCILRANNEKAMKACE